MFKKNLLVISNNFPNKDDISADDIFVKEQIKHLKNYFNNIYVIIPVAYGMDSLRGTKHYDYQFDNVRVFFPKYINNPLFWHYGRLTWIYLEGKAVRRLIEKEKLKFDLIHAHFSWPSGSVAVKLKKKYSVPIVITEHTSNTFRKVIETQDRIIIDAWHGADKIIRVRRSDISEFARVNISLDKVISIPNGYDRSKFFPMDLVECREKLRLPQDKKIILCVGNLYGEVKGHRYLIEAMSQITRKRDDIICIIVGDGKLRNVLERQIHSLGLGRYIMLAGKKAHDEISIWMNACDLFVLPSLNEGNPTVLVEALGCGKPFVGTSVGGIPEMITSEDYGFLVDPANSNDLSDKILSALDCKWDREKILRYSKRYSWDIIAKEIISVYNQIGLYRQSR